VPDLRIQAKKDTCLVPHNPHGILLRSSKG